MNKNNKKSKLSRLDKVLEMPKEISSNEPKITILGFNQMLIENYKGILEYQEFFIRVNTYIGILNINGFNLNLSEMTTDDILIGYEPTNSFLRLTPKAAAFFPEWIKANLMEDMDAESFWGMKHAMEKDEEEERRNH